MLLCSESMSMHFKIAKAGGPIFWMNPSIHKYTGSEWTSALISFHSVVWLTAFCHSSWRVGLSQLRFCFQLIISKAVQLINHVEIEGLFRLDAGSPVSGAVRPEPLSLKDEPFWSSISVAQLEDGRSDPEQRSAADPTRRRSGPLVAAGSWSTVVAWLLRLPLTHCFHPAESEQRSIRCVGSQFNHKHPAEREVIFFLLVNIYLLVYLTRSFNTESRE